jgi:hypothetical protein
MSNNREEQWRRRGMNIIQRKSKCREMIWQMWITMGVFHDIKYNTQSATVGHAGL